MPDGYRNIYGTRAAMPPRYFGNIAYYVAVAAHGGDAFMNPSVLFDKRQKSVHRCEIADVRGRVQLTVPITKPHGIPHATWSQVAISPHGQWWHIHRTTLESAYGRTPFFEFYIDRFLPFLQPDTHLRFPSIVHLNQALDAEIRKILLLPQAPAATDQTQTPCVHQSDVTADFATLVEPYWQVRSQSLGFIPNLSILDLIFNLGPESPLYFTNILSAIQPA